MNPAIFKRVHHSFFQSHSFQMRVGESALHYFVDLNAQIFRSGHGFGKFLKHVQILQIVSGEHFPFDELIEVDKIADHAGSGIHWAADGDFERIVVSVPEGIIAFAVGGTVFGLRHLLAMQAMRCGKTIAAI